MCYELFTLKFCNINTIIQVFRSLHQWLSPPMHAAHGRLLEELLGSIPRLLRNPNNVGQRACFEINLSVWQEVQRCPL